MMGTAFLGHFGTAWLDWLLAMSWQVGVLAAVVLGISLLARKASPRFRYALWCLVLIKLCLPPSLTLVTGVGRWLTGPPAAISLSRTAAPDPRPVDMPEPLAAIQARDLVPIVAPAPTLPSSTRATVPWVRVVPVLVWLGGMLAMAGLLALSHGRMRRQVRSGTLVTDPMVLGALCEARDALRVRSPLPLLAADGVGSPMLFGLLRPRILLPASALTATGPVELKPIFLHELVHLRRRDLWVNWLQVVLQTVYWFHPLVWLANLRLRAERELIVDDVVLAHLEGRREIYGESLLRVLQQAAHRQWLAPAYVGIVEPQARIALRLQRILDPDRELSLQLGWLSRTAVAALALVLIPQARPAGEAAASPAGIPAAAWSQPADGLQARLVADRSVYEEGQRIWLWLDVLNATEKPVEIAYGSSLRAHLRLVSGPGGPVLPLKDEPPGNVGTRALPPGRQYEVLLFYITGNRYASYAPLKPGKYEAFWVREPGETVKGARLPTSSRVAFQVVPAKADAAPRSRKTAAVPWGAAQGGLRTRLRADFREFAAGAPIPIVVEAENLGKRTVSYHVPQVAMNAGLEVLDSAGSAMPYIGGMGQTMDPLASLAPGEKAVLDSVDLTACYFLRKPGRYLVRWPGAEAWGALPAGTEGMPETPSDVALPATGTMEFVVLPSEWQDPFELALGLLLEKRPKEWSVTSPPPLSGLDRPGSQWSRVPCRSYRLEHKDMYQDGRLDRLQIPPVTLYVASAKAVEEPWDLDEAQAEDRTEYIGFSAFGHVYLKPPDTNALKRWPTLKADLAAWLGVRTSAG